MKITEITEPVPMDEYRGEHQAAGPGDGCPMWDVCRNEIYPKDFYQLGHQYLGGETGDHEALGKVYWAHNRPNNILTVYRAIPTGLGRGITINPGDWVTIVRAYATEHGRSHLNRKYRILQAIAHPRDLYTDGNSLLEWGYWPQRPLRLGGAPIHSVRNPIASHQQPDPHPTTPPGYPPPLNEGSPLVTPRAEFRNNIGILIGTTETVGHLTTGRDRNGRSVGTYDSEADVTRNYNGVRVGSGNLLSSLFLTFTGK